MSKIQVLSKNEKNFYIELNSGLFIISTEKIGNEEISSIIQKKGKKIPFIMFVGNKILPEIESYNSIHIFPTKKRVIEIRYRLKNENNVYRIVIRTNAFIEFYPVYVGYVTNIKSELSSLSMEFKKKFDLVIFERDLNRLDVLQLKISFTKAKLVIAGEQASNLNEVEWDNYRITDIASKLGTEILSKNLVYSARYYLRNLDFKKMYELPFHFYIKKEEIEIVITFLELMIKNEQNKQELKNVNFDLKILKFFYEFIFNLNDKNFSKLEELITEEIERIFKIESLLFRDKNKIKAMLEKFLDVIRHYKKEYLKKGSIPKMEEIQYWQIETLLELKFQKL